MALPEGFEVQASHPTTILVEEGFLHKNLKKISLLETDFKPFEDLKIAPMATQPPHLTGIFHCSFSNSSLTIN